MEIGNMGIKSTSEYFILYLQLFQDLKSKLPTKNHKALQDLASGSFQFDHLPCHSPLPSLLSSKKAGSIHITLQNPTRATNHNHSILQFLQGTRNSSNHIIYIF